MQKYIVVIKEYLCYLTNCEDNDNFSPSFVQWRVWNPKVQNKLDESPCPFFICFTKPLVLLAPFSSWILAFAPVRDISFGTTHSNFCMAELYKKHLFIKTHETLKSNKANRKTSPLWETQLSTFLWRSAQKYHRCFFTCILLQTKTVSFIRWFPNVVQS